MHIARQISKTASRKPQLEHIKAFKINLFFNLFFVFLFIASHKFFLNRCRCCSLWIWWSRLQPDVFSAMHTPTTSTPSLSTLTSRRSSPPTTCGSTCGTWRSPTAASVSSHCLLLKPVWTENKFVRAHQSCRLSTIRAVSRVLNVSSTRESQGCSLMLVSQTLWTSSPPTWRSWRKWSPPQSFTRSSVTPSPTAAARAQYACVTWDRLRSVTNTANVSVSITRVRHENRFSFTRCFSVYYITHNRFFFIVLLLSVLVSLATPSLIFTDH